MKSQGDKDRIIDGDLQSALDGLFGTSASLSPGTLRTGYERVDGHLELARGNWTLRAWGYLLDDDEMGDGVTATLAPGNNLDVKEGVLDLNHSTKSLMADTTFTTRLNYSHRNTNPYFQLLPARAAVPIGVDGTLTDITGTPDIFMDDQVRRLHYASLQDEWAFANHWELTVGVRYDEYSDFGSTANPRAALVWETRPELTTKLMYGRAFRPPTFTELYAKNNPSILGNTNLQPETINTYELAFDYQPTSRVRTVASLFTYQIKDLIELVPDPGQTTLTAQNHKDQSGHGIELEAEWTVLDTLRLKGNVAYQRSKDDTTNEVVPEAPGLQWYASALWDFRPEWSLHGQYLWIGDRHRAATDTRPDIADYDLVNLTLRRKNIVRHWDAAVAVRNLFNEDAREPSQAVITNDYPMESRAIWGEISCHF